MKKTLTIVTTTLIILIASKTQAQDIKEYVKSYINFVGGFSIPTGNFAKTDYNNNSAGFAKRGPVFGLEGAYYFYKNLAFVAALTYQDQGELSQNDVQNLANGYNTSFNRDYAIGTGVGRYNSVNILGGPQYSFVYKKFTLDLRASVGIIRSFSTPTLSIEFVNTTNTSVIYSQNSAKGTVFAYGGGAGLRYALGDHWFVNLRGNYINSDGFKVSNTNNPGTVGRFVTRQPVTELQTTLGIAVNL